MPYSSATPQKRARINENYHTPALTPRTPRDIFRTPLQPLPTPVNVNSAVKFAGFVDGHTPVPKRRKIAKEVTQDELARLGRERQAREAAEGLRKQEEERERCREEEQFRREASETKLKCAMQDLRARGYPTLFSFINAFLETKDPTLSSQVSRMIGIHGTSLLAGFEIRQPEIVHDWAVSTHRKLVDIESTALANHFKPRKGASVTSILNNFSVHQFLADAESIAPTTFQVLRQVGFPDVSEESPRKDRDLILASTLCMLAKSRNDHATEFQTTMCMFFLACGTSRSLFDVLNHAGISLSYTQAIAKLKKLGLERLEKTRKIAHTCAFMVIWDNLNIAFKVSEQRHDSKDHFDNGTTATLVPLYGVEYGGLPVTLKPKRERRNTILEIKPEDLVPTQEEAARVQFGQLWHIEDILYDQFPALRKRLGSAIKPAPSVLQIPVHKTEQYPLPAMHIDESSLEGTLGVLNTIFRDSLKLTEDDIKKHGIVICAGDQLSLSLLDNVSGLRRDDSDFLDNVGLYTEGQEGLLHIKFSHTRMIANEFWGKPNAKSPWSLWKVNTLLGRKAITVGWKAKSLPPFRPVYELMLNLALPANILDAFRIYCREDTLENWVSNIKSVHEVRVVAKQVLDELCSGRRVAHLRRSKPARRDVSFENICLFNRDCLYLRQLKYGIKRGDVGAVLDIITHSLLAFCGTGKTPKYADALFAMVIRLKRMDPKLREAWLMNWLANLSGCPNRFKEMDLLEEHLNFWAKIIYNAKGSNRTWTWLAMVSVSIFALRDVIRKVQSEFQTPFNSINHTSPSTATDIHVLRDYLESQRIQTYWPEREHGDDNMEARDLIAVGSEYANKPAAFRNFTYTKINATNGGVPEVAVPHDHEAEGSDLEREEDEYDFGSENGLEFDDLSLDDEEFPLGSNAEDYISMVHEPS